MLSSNIRKIRGSTNGGYLRLRFLLKQVKIIIHFLRYIISYSGDLARILINLIGIALMLIFIFKKDIAILQKVSLTGVLAAVYNTIILIITLFIGFTVPDC